MIYLSFDIGIKNLCYCLSDNNSIIKWNIIDISGRDIYDISTKALTELQKIDKIYDIVLIENQPVQKNPKMKSIQMIIFTFFMYNKTCLGANITDIILMSATRKNKYMFNFDISVPDYKSKYTKCKKMSIECTKYLLNNDERWYDYFLSHKKKDDLADSYLQTLAYINHTPVLPNPPSPRSVSSNDSTTSTGD